MPEESLYCLQLIFLTIDSNYLGNENILKSAKGGAQLVYNIFSIFLLTLPGELTEFGDSLPLKLNQLPR